LAGRQRLAVTLPKGYFGDKTPVKFEGYTLVRNNITNGNKNRPQKKGNAHNLSWM
jgi:hypothetical protein